MAFPLGPCCLGRGGICMPPCSNISKLRVCLSCLVSSLRRRNSIQAWPLHTHCRETHTSVTCVAAYMREPAAARHGPQGQDQREKAPSVALEAFARRGA